jgi:hypothetical protein
MASESRGIVPEQDREKVGFELYYETAADMQSHDDSADESDSESENIESESEPVDSLEERADRINANVIEEWQRAVDIEIQQQREAATNQNASGYKYILPAETTMQAFRHLAGNESLMLFEKDSLGSPVAKDEHELFIQMSPSYKRNATTSSPTGYNVFQKAWCQEAGRQMFASQEAGNNEKTIHYQSRLQLQQY